MLGSFQASTWVPGSQHAFATQLHQSHLKQHSRPKRLRVAAGAADVVGILVGSALPFVAVQALADSKLGKDLQTSLQNQKPQFEKQAAERAKQEQRARQASPWYGPERPKWLGPVAFDYPQHLQGEAPADYGFDVLGLGQDEQQFERYFELELLHARWAMLGALGALLPEVLQYAGVAQFLEPVWWNVGYAKLQGEDLNYLGVAGLRVAGGQGILIIAVCQVLLMYGPEYARACGIDALEPLGIYLPGDKNYPGGVFDPLGLADDPGKFEELKVKELKNGRLAMVAWLGFFVQALVTQRGPLQNLLDFVADPAGNNVAAELAM